MVVRGPTGAGTRSGPFHSISPESLLAHHPGIKVVAPSNPYDAKGLLVAAVNDPNPVMYLEHKKLYRKPDIKMEVPLGLYEVQIGSLGKTPLTVTGILFWFILNTPSLTI